MSRQYDFIDYTSKETTSFNSTLYPLANPEQLDYFLQSAKSSAHTNFSFLKEFFNTNPNISDFQGICESFCVNDGETNSTPFKFSSINLKIFAVSSILFVSANTLFAMTHKTLLNRAEVETSQFFVLSLIGCIFILIFVYTLFNKFMLSRVCTEKTDAVCVDVLTKYRRDSDDDSISETYSPLYYINYKGKGYVLISSISTGNVDITKGDFVDDLYINPNNPYDFYRRNQYSDSVLPTVASAFFLLPLIITYLSLL